MPSRSIMNALRAGAVLLASALGAHATTINFDANVGGNPGDPYVEAGYQFDPNKSNNDVKCAENRCLMEVQQGTITTMTRVDGLAFDLLGFYFALVGVGNDQNPDETQSIVVTGYYEAGGSVSQTFTLDELLSSYLPDYLVTGYDEPTDTTIDKNDGYVVSILNGLFNGVTSVTWETNYLACKKDHGDTVCADDPKSAQARLDNVVVASVPVPAAGWMLVAGIAALGGLAGLRRHKRAA